MPDPQAESTFRRSKLNRELLAATSACGALAILPRTDPAAQERSRAGEPEQATDRGRSLRGGTDRWSCVAGTARATSSPRFIILGTGRSGWRVPGRARGRSCSIPRTRSGRGPAARSSQQIVSEGTVSLALRAKQVVVLAREED